MSNQSIRRALMFVAIPLLIATAAVAHAPQDTPEEQDSTQQSGEKDDPAIARANRNKAQFEAETAAFQAQKARDDAEVAAARSTFGPLSSYQGAKGATTVDSANRGELEATLLSAIAIQEAVEPLAADVVGLVGEFNQRGGRRLNYGCVEAAGCDDAAEATSFDVQGRPAQELCSEVGRLGSAPPPARYRPIVIVSEDAQGPAALAESFDVRTAALARELCRALAESGSIMRRDARTMNLGSLGRERAGGFSPAAVGAVLDIAGNLLRTDYSIYGIKVAPDQNQLVREMAGAILAAHLPNPVYTPGLFPVGSTTDSNPVLQRIALLDQLTAEAADAAAQHDAAEGQIAQRGASVTGDAARVLTALKGDHERIEARLKAAADAYRALMTELTATTNGQPPLLTGIVRQANTAALLRRGALLVVTKIHFQGGTAFSRQNFFSSMFGMPYRVSGGALISSIVQEGTTGQVYQTEVVPVSGGFHGPTQMRRVVEEARTQRRERRRAMVH